MSVHERVYDSCTVIGGARGLVSNFFKPSCLHFCLFKACSHCSVKEGREGGGVDYPTILENIKQPVEVTCLTVGFGLQTFGSLFLFYNKSHISTPRLRAGSCIKHIWTVFSQHFNPKLMSYNLKNCRTVPAIMMHSTSKLWRLRDVKFSDFSTQFSTLVF